MSMNLGPGEGEAEVMVEMNTTPLIDVMLVLLVMLIITIPIQRHAVKLDMPRPNANNKPPAAPVVIDLVVDFDGTILWNGNVSTIDQTTRYLASTAVANPQPEIHLRPNRLAKYDTVAKVLSIAQRLGVRKIGFVGNEEYLK